MFANDGARERAIMYFGRGKNEIHTELHECKQKECIALGECQKFRKGFLQIMCFKLTFTSNIHREILTLQTTMQNYSDEKRSEHDKAYTFLQIECVNSLTLIIIE